MVRQEILCSCRLISCQALAHLRQPLRSPSLSGQHPALKSRPPSQVVCKPMLATEHHHCLCRLLGSLHLPMVLIQPGRKVQRKDQAEGVRQLPGQGKRLLALLQGLVWIAQQPSHVGRISAAAYAWVLPTIEPGMGAVLLGLIESDTLVQMGPSWDQVSQEKPERPHAIVGLEEESWIVQALSQGEVLLP